MKSDVFSEEKINVNPSGIFSLNFKILEEKSEKSVKSEKSEDIYP